MNEYSEKRTVVEEVPIKRARPVVETQYESVVQEHRGMSGGAIAALVLAAIAAAVVITILILNSQQKNNDDQLAQERARAAAAQQATSQQPVQQPVQPAQQPQIVVMPSSPPATAPAPAAAPPATTESAPSSAQVEIDVTSKLLDDSELRTHSIEVKVAGRTAVLSGHVPTDELKTRAEQLARSVRGVGRVINSITVQP